MKTNSINDGSGGDNYSYKICKAPVKSSSTTNIVFIDGVGKMFLWWSFVVDCHVLTVIVRNS